jgi:septum formation protein
MTSLVLASGSAIRARLLRDVGIPFAVQPAHVDEESVKASMRGADGAAIAVALAERKAVAISSLRRSELVLGADQILMLGDELMSKADTLGAAATQLRRLRGRRHQLIGALVLAKDGAAVWRYTETSTLWVRDFGEEFLDAYLAAEGEAVLGSVGCYRYEGLGAQLFERVEGDYFSILGLSLLPLLAALRDRGVITR